MDRDKALPASSGIRISIPKRFDRYHLDDNFTGLSSSPPPSVNREPPKFTIRKSKFFSLLGGDHSPPIPEEGPLTVDKTQWKSKESPPNGDTKGTKGLKKCSSSPSLTALALESESNKVSGEIMRHTLNNVTTERYDIASPHGSIETSPASTTVLKMFEQASKLNYFEDVKHADMAVVGKDVKTHNSQSVPASPQVSPKTRRRNLSGENSNIAGQKSITSAIMESFSSPVDPLKSQHQKEEKFEHKPITSQAMNFMYQWGTTSKVKVSSKDLNMFAPSSS